jgi:hypothetical protein
MPGTARSGPYTQESNPDGLIGGDMDEGTNVPAQETQGLPPVYLEVPHQSGLQGAGTSNLLNTGLTAAEARIVSEPAPVQYATTSQKRTRDILGVTWILACITAGVMLGVYEDAADGPYQGEADWALVVLGLIAPFAVVFSFYPHWQGWRHKKRHKAWLAQFIASWRRPYRIGHLCPGRYPGSGLAGGAQQAVDRFSELAGRRRENFPPSGPPSVPGQQLRRRRNRSVNDVGNLPE